MSFFQCLDFVHPRTVICNVHDFLRYGERPLHQSGSYSLLHNDSTVRGCHITGAPLVICDFAQDMITVNYFFTFMPLASDTTYIELLWKHVQTGDVQVHLLLVRVGNVCSVCADGSAKGHTRRSFRRGKIGGSHIP